MKPSRITAGLALLLAPLPLAAVACGDTTPGAADASERELAELSLAPIVRIGSIDDPEQSLTDVSQVLIGPDERLYVLQPRERAIRVFDLGGGLVRTIGRSGSGPGEFGQIGHAGFRGDTLYASDSGNGRITFFTPDGDLLESKRWVTEERFGSDMAYLATAPQILLADGTALARPGAAEPAMRIDGPGIRTGVSRTPIMRVDERSAVMDTLLWHEEHNVLAILAAGGAHYAFQSPFRDSPLVELMPDGSGVIVVERGLAPGDGAAPAFRVTLLGPRGETVFTRELPFTPHRLTDADVRWQLERVRIHPADGAPGVGERERALREDGRIPATKVAVTGLAVGQDGTIWLRREEERGEPVRWQILDRLGETRGSIRLPAGQRIVGAARDLVVTVEHDELDVPYVLASRLGST